MRIIAGIHRHRRLLGPKEGDRTTRPMLDRVKQALFDRLWALDMFPVPDQEGTVIRSGHVLDLFCGAGQLGLEALSRGCDHCTFIDRDIRHQSLVRDNLALLELLEQGTVLGGDILSGAWLNSLIHQPVKLVFCDPPYAMAQDPAELARLIEVLTQCRQSGRVQATGLLVLRTPERVPPPAIPAWMPPERRTYGKMHLALYAPA